MRQLAILIGILALSIGALAAQPESATPDQVKPVSTLPQMAPSPDETPPVGSGNAQTDALLDCYTKFDGPDARALSLGPPRISESPVYGYVLRSDFKKSGDSRSTVDRLLCWSGGFVTQKNLSIPPLYAPHVEVPDNATERAIVGWRTRRNEEAARAASAQPYPAPDSSLAHQLEGIWLIGEKPDKGSCISNWYQGTQIEFEFRKTSGRVLIFESPDLFSAISISGVAKSGSVLSIQGRMRDGGLKEFLQIRWLTADSFEILQTNADASRQIAYKCGEANHSVTTGVGFDSLARLASPASGASAFPATIPGVSDSDRCEGHALQPKEILSAKSIQFEVFGPVHYWVFGWGFWPDHKLGYDFIRSIEDKGNGVLVLHMQEHLDKGAGWDVEASQGKSYVLTVIDHGDHIEIPELSASFVRCKPSDPGSLGMHRW